MKDTIHITITEMEDTYNMELTDYIQAYKSEFDLDIEPYVIDVINYYKDIRDMYTLTLNGIMEKLNLQTENNTVSGNIFDELAAQI